MKVVELAPEHRDLFAVCLEDWSEEAREAGPTRARWIERFLSRGLRAQLALGDGGQLGGMIQYLPIEQSFVDGEGLFFAPCIWVHGHTQGRGNFQGRGMGSALLEEAEADARRLGARGMAAWGIWLPFWMKARWFKRHGYQKADRQGLAVLLWKPFDADARPPRWFRPTRPVPAGAADRVTVTSFVDGWCMAANLTHERARRAAAEFGDRVVFREIDTSEHAAVAEWGQTDGVFIDGKKLRSGPPPTYDRIRKAIEQRVARLQA